MPIKDVAPTLQKKTKRPIRDSSLSLSLIISAYMYFNRAFAAPVRVRSFSLMSKSVSRLTALQSHLVLAPPSSTTIPASRSNRLISTATTMSVPSTQKAVVVETTGGPEVLQYKTDWPVPTPKEGEVLVKNNVTSINYIDTYYRTGLYPAPKPEVLGRDGAGTIAALGPGENKYGFKVGDRVVWMKTGGYAEYTVVPAGDAVKIPDGVSDEDAVSGILSGLTVLSLVKETYPVQKGETVLLHAAAGGAGFLMTQLLKQIGAIVIGTAGGPEKVELVKSLGADHVIDYRSEEGKDWVKAVKEITNGRGVDVVFDSVGKDTWEGSLDAVKKKGVVVWFGSASGPVPPFPVQ